MDSASGETPRQTVVCEISDTGFMDGIEIRQILQLLEIQNGNGVNDALSKTAETAGLIVRNGLVARLVMLVSRVFGTPREDDLQVGRAFELLKEPAVLNEIRTRGPSGSVDDAIATWQRLKSDPRLPKLKQFRDKFTAHLGKPNPQIARLKSNELVSFAHETTVLLDKLARATGAREQRLDAWDYQLKEAAEAFWKPWMHPTG